MCLLVFPHTYILQHLQIIYYMYLCYEFVADFVLKIWIM
jgi:hypothetical protein